MTLTIHPNTKPHCGSAGPILYADGKAWSVNTIGNEVVDWRYELDQRSCPECARHVQAAALLTAWCECEHISHTDDEGEGHGYGAHIPTQPTKLRDMGTWNLCEHCRLVCHHDNQ